MYISTKSAKVSYCQCRWHLYNKYLKTWQDRVSSPFLNPTSPHSWNWPDVCKCWVTPTNQLEQTDLGSQLSSVVIPNALLYLVSSQLALLLPYIITLPDSIMDTGQLVGDVKRVVAPPLIYRVRVPPEGQWHWLGHLPPHHLSDW